MAKKKQIPRKHIGKKVDEEQERRIGMILESLRKDKPTTSYLEAKHTYFEDQKYWDKEFDGLSEMGKQAAIQAQKDPELKKMIENVELPELPGKKRKNMTIAEAKLGVTVVLSHDECKKMGFATDMTTKAAVVEVKKKLGIA